MFREIFPALGHVNQALLPSLPGDALLLCSASWLFLHLFLNIIHQPLVGFFQWDFTCATYSGSGAFLTVPDLVQLPQGLHQPFLHSGDRGFTDVISSLSSFIAPIYFGSLVLKFTHLNFTHLIKIILVLKISLKTLHLGIHKWESSKRSLVASVFYFSLNIDVVFVIFQPWGTSLLKHPAVAL